MPASKPPSFPKVAAIVGALAVSTVLAWGVEVLCWTLRRLPGRYDNGGN